MGEISRILTGVTGMSSSIRDAWNQGVACRELHLRSHLPNKKIISYLTLVDDNPECQSRNVPQSIDEHEHTSIPHALRLRQKKLGCHGVPRCVGDHPATGNGVERRMFRGRIDHRNEMYNPCMYFPALRDRRDKERPSRITSFDILLVRHVPYQNQGYPGAEEMNSPAIAPLPSWSPKAAEGF